MNAIGWTVCSQCTEHTPESKYQHQIYSWESQTQAVIKALPYTKRLLYKAHSNTLPLLLLYVLFIVCTTWLSNACRKQADHAGWVPESFFSHNRRKLKYSIVLPAWRLKMKFWNAGTIGVQPGVMMLRNLNFSKISLLDQMNGNERILKSILCTLILLELNIRLWDVTKSWSSALFLAPGEAQRKVIRGRGERVVK